MRSRGPVRAWEWCGTPAYRTRYALNALHCSHLPQDPDPPGLFVAGRWLCIPPGPAPATANTIRPSLLSSPRIPIPLGWLSPVGYVDTPYLDEDLRISKGDKGSLFIASRGGIA